MIIVVNPRAEGFPHAVWKIKSSMCTSLFFRILMCIWRFCSSLVLLTIKCFSETTFHVSLSSIIRKLGKIDISYAVEITFCGVIIVVSSNIAVHPASSCIFPWLGSLITWCCSLHLILAVVFRNSLNSQRLDPLISLMNELPWNSSISHECTLGWFQWWCFAKVIIRVFPFPIICAKPCCLVCIG